MRRRERVADFGARMRTADREQRAGAGKRVVAVERRRPRIEFARRAIALELRDAQDRLRAWSS